jgi:hypothetical protein
MCYALNTHHGRVLACSKRGCYKEARLVCNQSGSAFSLMSSGQLLLCEVSVCLRRATVSESKRRPIPRDDGIPETSFSRRRPIPRDLPRAPPHSFNKHLFNDISVY